MRTSFVLLGAVTSLFALSACDRDRLSTTETTGANTPPAPPPPMPAPVQTVEPRADNTGLRGNDNNDHNRRAGGDTEERGAGMRDMGRDAGATGRAGAMTGMDMGPDAAVSGRASTGSRTEAMGGRDGGRTSAPNPYPCNGTRSVAFQEAAGLICHTVCGQDVDCPAGYGCTAHGTSVDRNGAVSTHAMYCAPK